MQAEGANKISENYDSNATLSKDKLAEKKLYTGFRGFLGQGEEKLTNIVLITLVSTFLMTGVLIGLAYTNPPDNTLIDFSSIFVFLTNLSALAFGFIFGRRSS